MSQVANMAGCGGSVYPQTKPGHTGEWLSRLLYASILAAGLCTTNNSLFNANLIVYIQTFFFLSMLALRSLGRPGLNQRQSGHRLLVALMLAWAASVTLSLLISPYALAAQPDARDRYLQTLMHVIFGGLVYTTLDRFACKPGVLLAMIPLTVLIVLVVYLVQWHVDPLYAMHSAKVWFNAPPMHDHIRHTGYQITAALAVLIAGFSALKTPGKQIGLALLMSLFWGFLFWCGGRSSILSVVAATMATGGFRFLQKKPVLVFVAWITGSAIVGFLLAEWMAVFPWNGLLQGIFKSVPDGLTGAEIHRISANRIMFWKTSMESLQGHALFGLGPQAYKWMPNHIYGLQPHNLFVQFLVEWGVVGTTLFLTMLFHLIRRGWIDVCQTGFGSGKLMAAIMIIALTVNGLTDGTWYHPQPSMYLAVAFAVWALPSSPSGDATGASLIR